MRSRRGTAKGDIESALRDFKSSGVEPLSPMGDIRLGTTFTMPIPSALPGASLRFPIGVIFVAHGQHSQKAALWFDPGIAQTVVVEV